MYAERLRHAATATGYYTGPALKLLGDTLDKLEADLERQSALRICTRILNPDGTRSDWQVALEIHEGIKHLTRIRPGRLLTEYEEALTVIAKSAKSADRIHRELVKILRNFGNTPPKKTHYNPFSITNIERASDELSSHL